MELETPSHRVGSNGPVKTILILSMCSALQASPLAEATVLARPWRDWVFYQAKAVRNVRIKENSPLVKLLPERDERAKYRFLIVLLGSTLPCTTAVCNSRPIERNHL
jgi:hypothetical protein